MSAARSILFRSAAPGLCALLVGVAACQKTEAQNPPQAPSGEGATLAQTTERALDRFDRVDADHDGKVTAAEIDAARTSADDGPRRGFGLGRADADGDGVVTRAEVEAQARDRFARMDTDHDGKVTREERRAGREARRGAPS